MWRRGAYAFFFFYLQDASERPDVHLKAVALLAEHLWGDVVGGSAQCLLPLSVKLYLGREAEVPFGKNQERRLHRDTEAFGF